MKKIISLFCVVLFLSACSKSSDPAPVTPQPPLKNIYFYSDADSNISAYDPQALTSTNLTTKGYSIGSLNYSFVTDSQTPNLFKLRTDGVMFGENGLFYYAKVDKFGSISTKQLSSATDFTILCKSNTLHVNEYLFFKQPGVDNKCNTNDDIGPFAIHSNMDESSSILTPAVYPLSALYTNSALEGWLMFGTDGTLYQSDLNFNSIKTIAVNLTTASIVNNLTTDKIFNLNGEYRILDSKTMNLKAAVLHTVVNSGFETNTNNATTLFFNDGSDFYSLPLDGSSNAGQLITETAPGVISIKSINGDVLVYTLTNIITVPGRTQLDVSIRSLNVVTKKITSLVTQDQSFALNFNSVIGARLYFSRVDWLDKSLYKAGMIFTDGTGVSEIPASSWVGSASYNELNSDKLVSTKKIILNQFVLDETNTVVGNKLLAYDSNSFTFDSVLATLDADTSVSSLYLNGTAGLGVLIAKDTVLDANVTVNYSADIFYIDFKKPDSYFRVTQSSGKGESLPF